VRAHMAACQQQLGGKPLVLQEFGKKPGGPGRTLLFTEVCFQGIASVCLLLGSAALKPSKEDRLSGIQQQLGGKPLVLQEFEKSREDQAGPCCLLRCVSPTRTDALSADLPACNMRSSAC
jgi:hypothetical protein